MARNDEYYGAERARQAYDALVSRYRREGLSQAGIDALVVLKLL